MKTLVSTIEPLRESTRINQDSSVTLPEITGSIVNANNTIAAQDINIVQ
ncbi:1869_t:CDS:1, partial [Dentiscutata heterogama]